MQKYGIRATKLTLDQFKKRSSVGHYLLIARKKGDKGDYKWFFKVSTSGFRLYGKLYRDIIIEDGRFSQSKGFFVKSLKGYSKVSVYYLDTKIFNPCNKKH